MLKIYKDRVVIEGHEQTKEQCETMTLLANAIKESKDFKVVDYKNGYAEFEKVGKSNELKFLPGAGSFNILTSDGTQVCYIESDGTCELSFIGKVLTITNCSVETVNSTYVDTYTTDAVATNTITMKQDILSLSSTTTTGDNVTIIFSSTSSTQKSVDLTTLAGWNDLADGTHNITIKAKGTGYSDSDASDSVQVTKSSGETWVLKSKLNSSILTSSINFISNEQNFIEIYRTYDDEFSNYLRYSTNTDNVSVYDGGSWSNDAYRTIVLNKPATGDLLTWLQANGTKQ